mmetsp:Transcript_5379/g.7761  ORF Transcript_5379/g.7761 Transcript_5379/m.7761 type:complete len:315 (+) Transcript_5379:1610-2554(+)
MNAAEAALYSLREQVSNMVAMFGRLNVTDKSMNCRLDHSQAKLQEAPSLVHHDIDLHICLVVGHSCNVVAEVHSMMTTSSGCMICIYSNAGLLLAQGGALNSERSTQLLDHGIVDGYGYSSNISKNRLRLGSTESRLVAACRTATEAYDKREEILAGSLEVLVGTLNQEVHLVDVEGQVYDVQEAHQTGKSRVQGAEQMCGILARCLAVDILSDQHLVVASYNHVSQVDCILDLASSACYALQVAWQLCYLSSDHDLRLAGKVSLQLQRAGFVLHLMAARYHVDNVLVSVDAHQLAYKQEHLETQLLISVDTYL